ncbi:MAG: cell wall-binding repeat-containing protein [Desulfitobacteriaceae bacterium]|nr:cell wall-binding repeat-containing protein [Desulfitobacteriaceae bacterium]
MRTRNRNQIKAAWLLGIISLFWLVPFGTNAAANVNPPLSVINIKLETTARAKGIPSLLLKAIAFRESGWRQWDSAGNPLMSAGDNPAIGIMQIASYDSEDLETIEKLKTDIDFNIERGADLLNQKFDEMVPQIGNGNRNILENWYFAIWAYNCWVKDDMSKNNPHQLTEGQITYQDSVLDLCAQNFIPSVSGAIRPVNISRPALEDIPEIGMPVPIPSPTPIHYRDLTVEVERLFGTGRIDTAVLVARAGWTDAGISKASRASRKVVLARADDFADALAGVPLAAKYDAPILITPPHEMDIRVLTEIKRLQPQEIFLLGAEGALGKEIVDSLLQAGFSSKQLVRIQGADRYETSAAIAELVGTSDGSAFVVTGENFPDALGAAGVAGKKGIPVVLMPSNQLNDSSLKALKGLDVQQVEVIGFNQTMYGLLKKELQELIPEVQVTSLRGVDRYATTVSVVGCRTDPVTEIILATGEDFPDALAGAAFAVHRNAILLLVPEDNLAEHPELVNYLRTVGPGVMPVKVLGGSQVIADRIIDQFKDIFNSEYF